MTFSASALSALINGSVEGDAEVTVYSFGKIEEATSGQLSFLANMKYEEYLYSTKASIIIVNNDLKLKQPIRATLIRVDNAYSAFAQLLEIYQQYTASSKTGIEEPCFISPGTHIAEDAYIGAFSYIGKNVSIGNKTKIFPGVFIGDSVQIGHNCIIHAGVKIYENCILHNNIVIHAGTVIGSDGFGYAPQTDGSYKKIPQTGNVVIEDDVEIGSNSTIDRATIGSTCLRNGVKIDNLVQVAHNVDIGSHTVIAAQAGISGSTRVGKRSRIGGQAGIVGHLNLADGTQVNAQSGVTKNTKENAAVTGSPAYDYTAMLRSQSALRRLPDLEKRIQELEALLNLLTNKNTD
jgi:UDP-3-O-[3-hydroxymyristoyl] glucosamine N-acyltransferase